MHNHSRDACNDHDDERHSLKGPSACQTKAAAAHSCCCSSSSGQQRLMSGQAWCRQSPQEHHQHDNGLDSGGRCLKSPAPATGSKAAAVIEGMRLLAQAQEHGFTADDLEVALALSPRAPLG